MKGHSLCQREIIASSWTYIEDTLWQFQPNLAQNILGLRELRILKMKTLLFFQGEIIATNWKYIETCWKYFFKNRWANFNQTCHKVFLGKGNSIYFQFKGHAFFQGEIIVTYRKYIDDCSNILLYNIICLRLKL